MKPILLTLLLIATPCVASVKPNVVREVLPVEQFTDAIWEWSLKLPACGYVCMEGRTLSPYIQADDYMLLEIISATYALKKGDTVVEAILGFPGAGCFRVVADISKDGKDVYLVEMTTRNVRGWVKRASIVAIVRRVVALKLN